MCDVALYTIMYTLVVMLSGPLWDGWILHEVACSSIMTAGATMGMGSANERRRYIATPSRICRAHTHNDPNATSPLIGWAHTQNDPCRLVHNIN